MRRAMQVDVQAIKARAVSYSQRATTSSRTPGRVNRGTVRSFVVYTRRCDDCGSMVDGACEPGRHSPRYRDGQLVNCVGQVITTLTDAECRGCLQAVPTDPRAGLCGVCQVSP